MFLFGFGFLGGLFVVFFLHYVVHFYKCEVSLTDLRKENTMKRTTTQEGKQLIGEDMSQNFFLFKEEHQTSQERINKNG